MQKKNTILSPFCLVSDLYMDHVYPNIKKTLPRNERRHIENQSVIDGCCIVM